MKAAVSLIVVLALVVLAYLGTGLGQAGFIFGIVLPYLALAVFLVGFVSRVLGWARSPVPFRIPTTCGQQKSLRWIKHDRLENPFTTWQVIGRMLLEVLFFRSLFRNTRMEMHQGKMTHGPSKWLWLGAIVFHYSMLVVLLRHLRLFTEPVPFFVGWIEAADGFLQIGVPVLYLTSLGLLAGLGYLLLRRLFIAQVRYISLLNDYFPLWLLLGIGSTGFLLRHFVKTDLVSIKSLTLGLISFSPQLPEGVHWLFYAHLLLVCTLFAYFPFSKLMHLGGVFLSPTRNLASNNRAVRHVNPWDYPVKVHTYEEYEDDFRDKMVAAGIPVEKQPQPAAAAEKE